MRILMAATVTLLLVAAAAPAHGEIREEDEYKGDWTWKSESTSKTEEARLEVKETSGGKENWIVRADSANARCENGEPTYEPKIRVSTTPVSFGGTCDLKRTGEGTLKPVWETEVLRIRDGEVTIEPLEGTGSFVDISDPPEPLVCYRTPEEGPLIEFC